MGQFNLRWNNHITNILQVFVEHLSSESLVDVTLSCEGRFIKAHKIILSACSPYFQELFESHTSKHTVVILNGIKFEYLQAIIRFMYNGEIRVEESELTDLLSTAETLQIKGLCNVREKGCDNSEKLKNQDESEVNEILLKDHSTQPSVINGDCKLINDTHNETERNPPRKRQKVSHAGNELGNTTTSTSHQVIHQESDKPWNSLESTSESLAIKVPGVPEKDIKKSRNRTKIKSRERQTIIYGENGPEKIRRPPNAFMIFANEWRRKLAMENPGDSNTEISVKLGVMWKGLTNETKESYYALARKVDEEHKKKYPGYFYSPKEARMRKNLKNDLMLARCLPPTHGDASDLVRCSRIYLNKTDSFSRSDGGNDCNPKPERKSFLKGIQETRGDQRVFFT